MLRSPFVFVSHTIIQSVFFVFFPSFLLCNPPLPKPFFLFLLPCFLSSLSLVFSSFSSPFQRIPFASFSPFSIPFHLYLPYRFLMLDPRPPPEFLSFPQSRIKIPEADTKCCLNIWCFFFVSVSLLSSKQALHHIKVHIWQQLQNTHLISSVCITTEFDLP